jgi:hypothetical protein
VDQTLRLRLGLGLRMRKCLHWNFKEGTFSNLMRRFLSKLIVLPDLLFRKRIRRLLDLHFVVLLIGKVRVVVLEIFICQSVIIRAL